MDIHKYVYVCMLYGTRTFIYEAVEFAKVVDDKKDGGGGGGAGDGGAGDSEMCVS